MVSGRETICLISLPAVVPTLVSFAGHGNDCRVACVSVRRSPSLTGKCSSTYPSPEDDFLGATDPCADRPKVPSVGHLLLHGRGSSSPPVRTDKSRAGREVATSLPARRGPDIKPDRPIAGHGNRRPCAAWGLCEGQEYEISTLEGRDRPSGRSARHPPAGPCGTSAPEPVSTGSPLAFCSQSCSTWRRPVGGRSHRRIEHRIYPFVIHPAEALADAMDVLRAPQLVARN
jgi:hypothetical protein